MTDTGPQGQHDPADASGQQHGAPVPPPYQFPQPVVAAPGKSPTRWVWRTVIAVALGLACIGGTSVAFGPGPDEPAEKQSPVSGSGIGKAARPSPSAKGDFAAKVGGSVPKGSRRSTYAVRKAGDLSRVCEGWFYPKAPKYTGLAPHSIAVSTRDDKNSDFRNVLPIYTLPYEATARVKDAWNPQDPAKVQLVACAEQVSVGAKVKNCQVDKPKPKKVPMKVSNYRVTLYEVATRRKLTQLRMKGEDETCGPFLIMIGLDGATYTELDDRQLVEALRRYVEE